MSTPLNMISANDLRTGLNVYFSQEGEATTWHTDAAKASVFAEDTIEAAFALAKKDMDQNVVVDCVIVPVDENHTPLTTREKIRAGGPSTAYGAQ
ncbi:DUF2849 domain-containing protein [Paremcibacter congregatus]|uniref:DUF2849 domain-containing protein n=1 Tax=Paremcibacter congregatus TaxID=2043170 RepID=UPI003A914F2A